MSYHLFIFSDVINDPILQYNVGYSMLAVIFIMLLINISSII